MTARALVVLVVVVVVVVVGGAHAHRRDVDVGLWLARSCVGEAGFDAAASGECAAIGHVYRKRIRTGTFWGVMRRYSAAIKPHAGNSQPWIFGLRRDGRRPDRWPTSVRWSERRDAWAETLRVADAILAGDVADPVPDAVHYGGDVDRERAARLGFIEIPTPFRNHFYRVRP